MLFTNFKDRSFRIKTALQLVKIREIYEADPRPDKENPFSGSMSPFRKSTILTEKQSAGVS